MDFNIILPWIGGIIIGIIIDYLLFRIWHRGAHSDKLRKEEKKQIEKEEKEIWGVIKDEEYRHK